MSRLFLPKSLSLVVFTLAVVSGAGCSVEDREVMVRGDAATEGGAGGNAGTGSDASVDRRIDGSGTGMNTDGSGDGGSGDGGAGDGSAGDGGACQSGALQCSAAGVPQKCVAGAFVDQAQCPVDMPTCEAGACVARCTASAKRCSPSGTAIQQCDLSGIWQDTTACPFACTGSGDASACAGMCKPGTRSCSANNTPVLCDVMGMNQTQAPCDNACLDGVCWGDCKPGTTRCTAGAANKVETCSSIGQWGLPATCTFVCDTTKQDCGGECALGMANRCSMSTVQNCDSTGHWKDMTNCGATPCTMGECRACNSGQKQCNAGKPQTCSAGGTWTDDQATACPFVCDAATGKCAGECVPGTDACTGNSTKHCAATGFYDAAVACSNICDTATGKCGGVCMPGTHRCNGSSQTCGSNGQWGSDMPCQYGCATATGLCNTCTDEAMATTCANGKCGPTTNNCAHTVQCSTSCAGMGQTCGGGGVNGVCGCTPQPVGVTCAGAKCNMVTNNCGQPVACPACVSPQTCGGGGVTGVCGCMKETDPQFCSRLGKTCGSVTAADNCGTQRTVANCGACNGMQTCSGSNTCVCQPNYTGPSCSVPRFEGLGPTTGLGGGAMGVSSDGTIVVGTAYTPSDDPVSYIWTRATADQTLLAADSARALSIKATGISGNGAVIVGIFDPPLQAFRWTSATKAVSIGGFTGSTFASAEGTNSDGSVVVGRSNKASSSSEYPFRWVNNVFNDVPGFSAPLPQTAVGQAWDVSDDGNVVVGGSDFGGHRVPFRWAVGQATATMLGVTDGLATAVSGNGLVVVGWLGTAGPYTAFRWTSGTSIQTLAGSGIGSSAQAADTNLDGTVVVGGGTLGPWIWDATNNARLVTTVLNAAQIDFTGWTLISCSGVSADGKILVGFGTPPSGPERGWIARLP